MARNVTAVFIQAKVSSALLDLWMMSAPYTVKQKTARPDIFPGIHCSFHLAIAVIRLKQ